MGSRSGSHDFTLLQSKSALGLVKNNIALLISRFNNLADFQWTKYFAVGAWPLCLTADLKFSSLFFIQKTAEEKRQYPLLQPRV
jgi:hypothetical protein